MTLVLALAAAGCGSDSGGVIHASAGVERANVLAETSVGDLVTGFNDAGLELLRTQPRDRNLVFSPLSIGHTLLMARGAADQQTGAAIDAAFGLPEGVSAHDAWNALDSELTATNDAATAVDGTPTPRVQVADRLWPASSLKPHQDWIDLMASHHGAEVETIDVTQAEASRQRINEWVASQTNDLIPELLTPGFINSNTTLVLTDVVYFKAQWQRIFGKYGTVTEPFTRLDGTQADTTYLVELELPGPRGRGDGFVGAEIPYLGDAYSMLVIVPDEGRFDEIRQRFNTTLLDEIDAIFSTGPYELHLPKWHTTTSIDLIEWLTTIGAAPGAYPGISPGTFLATAIHGADITVDETGTEAAAATGMGFELSGPPEPELVVAADKPFLYLIRNSDTGAILFAGQVTDPSA